LYEFLARRVFAASRDNSVEILDEVADILRTLKTAWDEIPEDLRKLPKEALEKKFAS
jgi:flagellar protein FliS